MISKIHLSTNFCLGKAAFCRCIRETAESEDAEMAAELYPHAAAWIARCSLVDLRSKSDSFLVSFRLLCEAILAEEHPDSTVRWVGMASAAVTVTDT